MTRNTYRLIIRTGSALGLVALLFAMPVGSTTHAASRVTVPFKMGMVSQNPLDKIAATYQKHPRLEAAFEFRYFRNEQDQNGAAESGTLLLDQQSGKYRITLPGQVLISDGKSQWAILKDVEEVQVTEMDHSSNSINPSNVFSFFTSGYSHKVLPGEQVGSTPLQVIELTPTERGTSFSKVIIRAHRDNHELYDVTVFDRNKSKYSYQIRSLNTNPKIADQNFVFNKAEFPGMEIVDLR